MHRAIPTDTRDTDMCIGIECTKRVTGLILKNMRPYAYKQMFSFAHVCELFVFTNVKSLNPYFCILNQDKTTNFFSV